MENNSSDKFIELLKRNKEEEIMNFLISKGKSPKPVCPIIFIKDKENEE